MNCNTATAKSHDCGSRCGGVHLAQLICFLDVSDTVVTSVEVKDLKKLEKLESLNLTQTKVTRNGAAELQSKPRLKRLYLFEAH